MGNTFSSSTSRIRSAVTWPRRRRQVILLLQEAIRLGELQTVNDICSCTMSKACGATIPGDLDSFNALHIAAQIGDAEATRLLLGKANVDPSIPCKDDMTAIHVAAQHGHGLVVSVLLQHMPQVNLVEACDKYKRTVLHHAAMSGDVETIHRILLHRNGKELAMQKDQWHRTPLHIAAQHGNTDACRLLVECGDASPLAETSLGETPLDFALHKFQHSAASFLTDIMKHQSMPTFLMGKRSGPLRHLFNSDIFDKALVGHIFKF
jgi:hypothetical protein